MVTSVHTGIEGTTVQGALEGAEASLDWRSAEYGVRHEGTAPYRHGTVIPKGSRELLQ